MEAARGAVKTVRFQRHVACETCNGSGAKPGTRPETCRYCNGHGRVMQPTRRLFAANHLPRLPRPRPGDPRGVRRLPRLGLCRENRHAKVEIPAGVDDRSRLRLQGEGEPSPNGGPPGDCYCFIHVKEHPLFQRRGQDLFCEVPITYTQAVLGADDRRALVGRLRGIADSGGHAERRGLHAQGAGHARPTPPRSRPLVGAGHRRGAPHADRRT